MNAKVRVSGTARELAALHDSLARAYRGLAEAGKHPLNKSSQTTLHRMSSRIVSIVYALETPFARATDRRDAPFVSLDNPGAWNDWLDKMEAP